MRWQINLHKVASMINLQELKRNVIKCDERSAIFYLYGGIGDKLMYLCNLKNYKKLFNCNVIICSKEGTSEAILDLFPEYESRHIVFPIKFYEGYTDELFMHEICDDRHGVGRIFCTWCLKNYDVATTSAWMKINSLNYNIYQLAKRQLSISAEEKSELIDFQENYDIDYIKGPYVFICPLANSVKNQLPLEFWVQLVKSLSTMGYGCILNAIKPINHKSYDLSAFSELGCEFFFGNLKETINIARNARHTFAIRSGIADLFSLIPDISYSVIFPRDFANLEKFFSLNRCDGNNPKIERIIDSDSPTEIDELARQFIGILNCSPS